MKDVQIQQDSVAWKFFVVVSFVMSLGATSMGILILPVEMWVRGYIAMGLYFTISSCFILSKTLRDAHEADKLVNKISDARTNKMLKEFDVSA